MPKKFAVTILGSSSAIPAKGRAQSAQVLTHSNNHYLIDCGENTQVLLHKYRFNHNKLQAIFISHLHGDHYLGLFGLISSMSLLGRKAPLQIFGPRGLREIIIIQAKYSGTRFNYKIKVTELDENENGIIFEDNKLKVNTYKLIHRVDAHGYRFKEKPQLHKLKIDLIPPYCKNSDFQKLKSGVDVILENGEILKYKEHTIPAPPQRSYAYCSDTAYNEEMIGDIANSTMLYHESTFLEKHKERAEATQHSTPKQAASIAKKAKVKKLLIGHFSARYVDLDPFKNEAVEVFTNSHLAIEGQTFTIE